MNSASKLIHSHWFFKIIKKKTIYKNSAIVETCFTVMVPPREKQQNTASTKLAVSSLFLVGSTSIKYFFFNQTILYMVTGKQTSLASTLQKRHSINQSLRTYIKVLYAGSSALALS